MITTSKPNLDTIFKEAFYYWKNTWNYQLLFSLLFFTILSTVAYFGALHFGIFDQYMSIFQKNKGNMIELQNQVKALTQTPGYNYFSWTILATMIFLFPLNIGFYKIYRKMDLKEAIVLQDFFSGYSGINFFIYISYYLFWSMIYNITMATVVFGVIWVFVTLFVVPLMFFENKTIFESIKLNFQALKKHFLIIFVCLFAAIFIKYIGIFVFGIGILFTYPFVNAMIYALYKSLFVEDKLKETPVY
jgi:hypothetical protein